MNKKIVFIIPMLVAMLPALGSCGKKETSQDDPTKANLYIQTLNKGIGMKWLQNAAKEFEELYAESTDFQKGRTGVKIHVQGDTLTDGDYIRKSVLNKDIYFTEQIEYRYLVNSKKFLDITDVLTSDLSEYGDAEGRTILSKLDPTMENYLNVDNKYYAVPFYDSFYGLVYDVTLWKEKKLYLSTDPDDRFVRYGDESMTLGPDNIAGTPDDGLPATYEEFALLLKELDDRGITPFITAQNAKEYMADYLYNVVADYEGVDNMVLNLTLDGTATDLIKSVDNDGNITYEEDPVTITQSNGYRLTRQPGKYYALSFLKNVLMKKSSYYRLVDKHTNAQMQFVQKNVSGGRPNVAMILEGSWWENEAASAIAKEEARTGKRDYAIMPIPFATSEKAAASGYQHTYLSLSQSFGIVSAKTRNQKLAKEFMRFLHSDKMLSKFTADTSITRPLNYEVSEEDQANLSSYAKSLIYLKKNSTIVYPYSSQPLEVKYATYFKHHNFVWKAKVDNTPYGHPWDYFLSSNPGVKTVKKYFDGQYAFFSDIWKNLK